MAIWIPMVLKRQERKKASQYSYLPGVMCWAMKSMNAATWEKMPGEPRAVMLLLRVSHPLAQLTPQDTTMARVQVPPALRHARGPPESPCPPLAKKGAIYSCASSPNL